MDPPDLSKLFQQGDLLRDLISTAVLLFVVFGIRFLTLRALRRNVRGSDQTLLKWAAQIRWLSYLLVGIGLFFIWSAQIREIAISFVVLAMAFVWATKETIACIQGAIYRVSSDAFAVGDRIQIGEVHGDVINQTLLGTVVLEVGPGVQRTGRVITLPNSLLLTEPVLNESLAGDSVLHVMTIPVSRSENLAEVERRALHAAEDACSEFIDTIRREIKSRYRRNGLTAPNVDPRITYDIIDKDTVNLLLRMPTPVMRIRQTEQRVLRAVLGVPKGRDSLPPSDVPPKGSRATSF